MTSDDWKSAKSSKSSKSSSAIRLLLDEGAVGCEGAGGGAIRGGDSAGLAVELLDMTEEEGRLDGGRGNRNGEDDRDTGVEACEVLPRTTAPGYSSPSGTSLCVDRTEDAVGGGEEKEEEGDGTVKESGILGRRGGERAR